MALKRVCRELGKALSMITADQKAIDRSLEIVNESIEMCKTSPKPETRISRSSVAISTLEQLIQNYSWRPEVKNWKPWLESMQANRKSFVMQNLQEIYTLAVATIEESNTARTKYNRAQKLITKLQGYFTDSDCDRAVANNWIKELKRNYPEP